MDAILRFILILLTCSFLQSCMNAAVSSAQAVYNRHTIQTTLNDYYVAMKSEREIYLDNNRFQNTHVSVSSFNGVVLLAGQAPAPEQKQEIEQIVKKISETNEIHNLITIAPPISPLIQLSDTWITTKIKSKLIATNGVDPGQIKVITENGTVYLMGIIPREQAAIAIDLAKTTEGVQDVVRSFGYLSISKA